MFHFKARLANSFFADELDKTKVTGVEPLNKLQDSANDAVAGQIGQGGLGEGLGNAVSKEGINRAERGGKDEQGETAPGMLGNAGGKVSSLWGGGKK